MKYSEKLKDPRWQKKRLEIFNRDDFACQSCHNKANTLHVHHRNYERGNEPWEYENYDLITLCDQCHEYERIGRAEEEGRLLEALRIRGYAAFEIAQVADWLINVPFEHLNSLLWNNLKGKNR